MVVEAFCKREASSNTSLSSSGDKLFSYKTCIAQVNGDLLIFNDSKYTATTAKHKGILRRVHKWKTIQLVQNVPTGATDLIPYLVNK